MDTAVAFQCNLSRGWAEVAAWSFVYVFFSNGVPFDAPNRSEPCPRSA